jgi:hypothetical protein
MISSDITVLCKATTGQTSWDFRVAAASMTTMVSFFHTKGIKQSVFCQVIKCVSPITVTNRRMSIEACKVEKNYALLLTIKKLN